MRGVGAMVAGAPVRQTGEDRAPAFDKRIEVARVHAPKECRYGPKSTTYDGVTIGDKPAILATLGTARPPPHPACA